VEEVTVVLMSSSPLKARIPDPFKPSGAGRRWIGGSRCGM
jgi:hypothetical protein